MKTPKKHGGKRAGAGRKSVNPEGRAIPISFGIPLAMLADLDAAAAELDLPRGRVITQALRQFLAARKRSAARAARRNT